ncbi:TPA: hypothetical protein ACKRET_003432 [Proteus mirabilis]
MAGKRIGASRCVSWLGISIAFLIIFYVLILVTPWVAITSLNLWDIEEVKKHSKAIFTCGVVVFVVSKSIDLFLTAKKSNSLLGLFITATLDAATPALFVFSMYKMDKYYYFIIVGISCVLLALTYSTKALSLDKQVTERKIAQFFYLNSKMKLVSQDIETVKTEVQKAISTQTKRLAVTIFVAFVAGITIAKLLF